MTKLSLYRAVFTLIAYVATTLAQANPTPQKPAPEDPLAPVAWFVGGTWVSDVKDSSDGSVTHVENRMRWSANHSAVVFNVDFNGKPHYYGMYAYNPAAKQIVFYYTNDEGELSTGTAILEAEGKTLRQEFDIMHTNGNTGHLRSTIARDGDNAYWLTVFMQRNGEWQQVFRIRYERKAE